MQDLKEKVYFIKIKEKEDDKNLSNRIKDVLINKDLLNFVQPKDWIAVKTHFGEEDTKGFVKPLYFKILYEELNKKNCYPFLTETATLYSGKRANAVEHIKIAKKHGFTLDQTGMPIIMADGAFGDEEKEIKIKGEIYKKVNIAALFTKIQGAVIVSHFTGHIQTGYGATLKNMGMGCASRKGKMEQHSSMKPKVNNVKCTACLDCIKCCPVQAISTDQEERVMINQDICYGCGQCLVVCRFDAVQYNWGKGIQMVQESCVEYAMGLHQILDNKVLYINFLNKITKDCDCMRGMFEQVADDIGVLLSFDPVAIDAASIDLVENRTNGMFRKRSYDIPSHYQIDHCKKLNFGNPNYQLVEA